MKKCYYFKKIKNNEYLFNVDAAYIITLVNSKRKEQYTEQLKKYKLSKNIYIQFNKGFKNCKKYINYINIKDVHSDILHSYLNVFKNAKDNNYKNILILEDDFIVSEKIKQNDIDNINNIIPHLNKEKKILRLGTFPWLSSINLKYKKFLNLHVGGGAQAIIYPEKIINDIVNKSKKKINILEFDPFIHQYKQLLYCKPLVNQLIVDTDSSKNWGNSNIILKKLSKLGMLIYKSLKLNKQPEPGTTIMYYCSIIIFYLLQIIVILTLIKIFKLLI